MHHTIRLGWPVLAVAAAAVLLAPASSRAQTISGQARAVQTAVFQPLGVVLTMLADTGTLAHSSDAREASQPTAAIGSLLGGAALHASTIGWADQVASEASVAALALTVGTTIVSADFVMSRAAAVQGAIGAGAVDVEGLVINGLPVAISGEPNQTIGVPGGRIVINEQQTSAGSAIVNALHITVAGAADVIVASASAAIR